MGAHARRKREGKCKLTGLTGAFVKAHILPKALTRNDDSGLPFAQTGQGKRPVRRWDSWYDSRLVIEKGEDILEAYDTWGIAELRKHQLVWSGWGPQLALSTSDFEPVPNSPYGIRVVEGIDALKLRLFYLSLLWRAAACSLPEFQEVALEASHMSRLRRMVCDGDPYPLDFYPISLTQLSTVGELHNHGPFLDVKQVDPLDGGPIEHIPIVRIYFDGLIAHIHREKGKAAQVSELGPQMVGNDPKRVALSTVTYEASWQRENLEEIRRDTFQNWPSEIARIHRLPLPGARGKPFP